MEKTLELLYEGIRISTTGTTDKGKMKATLKHLLEDVISIPNLSQIKHRSLQLNFTNDEVHEAIYLKDYYDLK